MTMTMKGLLKGLRYITQIFDDEKDSKMQIGHPTDVKHVAHIGSDCPSAMKPSWMNEYKDRKLHDGPIASRRDKDIINQGGHITSEGRTQTAGIGSQELQQHRSQKTRRKTRTSALPLDTTASSANVPSQQPISQHGSYGPPDSSSHMDPSSRITHNSVT